MNLSGIQGQERAVDALKRDLAGERLPPSYLFVGPEGVGKFTTALALAATLLCLSPEEDACEVCPACRKVAAGAHPDLLVIRRDGQFIKVGEVERKSGTPPQVRQLVAAAQRKPYESRVKVLVVDEAHRMTSSAANALLKTLEEPPDDTVIVLTATTLGALPPTIVSRCRVIRFLALDRDWLTSEIERVRDLSGPTARLLAGLANGNMTRALRADAEEVSGRRARALRLLDAGLSGETGAILQEVAGVGKSREDTEELLDLFMTLVRDVYAVRLGVPSELLVHGDLADELRRRASLRALEELTRLFERAKTLRLEMRIRNANPQLGWESLLLGLPPAAAGG